MRKSLRRTLPMASRAIFPSISSLLTKILKLYLTELDGWIARWGKMAVPLRGVKYVDTIRNGYTLLIDSA